VARPTAESGAPPVGDRRLYDATHG
jgi:hypothetical protein